MRKRERILTLAISVIMLMTGPTLISAGTKTNEATVYNHLTKGFGLNRAAASGVMTNIQAESGMKSNNLENLYNVRYGLTDAQYTNRVNKGIKNNGKYKSGFGKTRYFTRDYCGYGICQWTSLTRRKNLLKKANRKKVGIDNLSMQLEFLGDELKGSYPQVWTTLKSVPDNAEGAYLAAAHFCISFEVPANTNNTAKARASKAITTYWKKYSGRTEKKSDASYFGLCGYKYPKVIRKGSSFRLGGHAIGNHKVKSVTATITNSKGKKVRSKTLKGRSTAVALSGLSKGLKFNKLKAGKYTIRIRAKDTNGRVVSAKHSFKVVKGGKTSFGRSFSNKDNAPK